MTATFSVHVNIRRLEGSGVGRVSREDLAVTTSDTDKNAAIRRAITLLQTELADEDTNTMPKKATSISAWRDSEMR